MSKRIMRTPPEGEFVARPDDSLIICRCEEITRGEIRRAIYDGMRTMNEIKRYLRVGMGLCQGQTCNRLVQGIMAKELGLDPVEVDIPLSRSPARPIPMSVYANDGVTKEKGERKYE
ncbi:(2Fe-2S)-binding protein [Desulfoscipio gibsoniae]|uniref:NAD(P)H-nitrite reductase n=1 Tax=Desulfoscipio gibsoniae DSM 7213 TaxID=767817 RepID=R4KNZ4_9FIRM|nr:(2Fe-2S)-binding protein [Desulfoscipio gibsoniae]AGL02285.1 NAD(P)H-nitrite reductase [Desulfoscipio gibsoniae DSM 7213]